MMLLRHLSARAQTVSAQHRRFIVRRVQMQRFLQQARQNALLVVQMQIQNSAVPSADAMQAFRGKTGCAKPALRGLTNQCRGMLRAIPVRVAPGLQSPRPPQSRHARTVVWVTHHRPEAVLPPAASPGRHPHLWTNSFSRFRLFCHIHLQRSYRICRKNSRWLYPQQAPLAAVALWIRRT